MGKRIYCGNLSFQATEDEVRDLFSQYGEVTNVHMVVDRDTGRSRGFGFVEMATDEQAKAAIEALDGYMHQSRSLKVNEARPREERAPRSGGGGGRGFGGGGYGGGGGYSGGGGGGGFGGGGFGGRGGGGGGGGRRERRDRGSERYDRGESRW